MKKGRTRHDRGTRRGDNDNNSILIIIISSLIQELSSVSVSDSVRVGAAIHQRRARATSGDSLAEMSSKGSARAHTSATPCLPSCSYFLSLSPCLTFSLCGGMIDELPPLPCCCSITRVPHLNRIVHGQGGESGWQGGGGGGMPPKQALIDLDLDFQLVSASVLVLVSGFALWRRVVFLCRRRN